MSDWLILLLTAIALLAVTYAVGEWLCRRRATSSAARRQWRIGRQDGSDGESPAG